MSLQARLDRASTRQFSPRNERFQSGLAGSSTRPAVAPRNRSTRLPVLENSDGI